MKQTENSGNQGNLHVPPLSPPRQNSVNLRQADRLMRPKFSGLKQNMSQLEYCALPVRLLLWSLDPVHSWVMISVWRFLLAGFRDVNRDVHNKQSVCME